MGEVLSSPHINEPEGYTGTKKDYMMKKIQGYGWTKDVQVEKLMEQFTKAREIAVGLAQREDPSAFIKNEASKRPLSERKAAERIMRRKVFEDIESNLKKTKP
jgi:hypothetical protein